MTGVESKDQAMAKARELLPDKRRKDAVTCIEYLFTTSPEWASKASTKKQEEFFEKSKNWLAAKYGEENIIAATIQRDETTPHLSAFVVPLTKDGRLSAKEFIGNRTKMSDDQTSFSAAVAHLGLERGQKKSKARHVSIRKYYKDVNDAEKLSGKLSSARKEVGSMTKDDKTYQGKMPFTGANGFNVAVDFTNALFHKASDLADEKTRCSCPN